MTTKENKRPVLYTKNMVAAVIGISMHQLREWARNPCPELFVLPKQGNHPYHRTQVLTALNKMHNACKSIAPLSDIPETLYTTKQIMDYFKICRKTLYSWCVAGAPRFIFTEQTIRFLPSEVERWYVLTYGQPFIK